MSYAGLAHDVEVGKRVYLADGAIALRVTGVDGPRVQTVVETGGELREKQGINYPDGTLELDAVTDRDLEHLDFGIAQGVDWVAVSFVRTAQDVWRVKSHIGEAGATIPVIAKIEKHEALEHIDDILAVADAIMVARGDLGVEIPLEEVPMTQKDLIARANRVSKPVITATQMLESMISLAAPDARRGDRRRQRDPRRHRRRDALGRDRARRVSAGSGAHDGDDRAAGRVALSVQGDPQTAPTDSPASRPTRTSAVDRRGRGALGRRARAAADRHRHDDRQHRPPHLARSARARGSSRSRRSRRSRAGWRSCGASSRRSCRPIATSRR